MKGQSIIEYIIIVGIVVVALYAMGPAFKRGVQSVIKGTADQLASQKNAEQDYTPGGSFLDESNTESNMSSQRNVREQIYTVNTSFNDYSESTTNSLTNMGFTKQ